MTRSSRNTVVAARIVGPVAAIAAVCAPSATAIANAAPTNQFAPVTVSKITDDGWHITAVKGAETLRSVPSLDQSPWTREGFLTLTSRGVIAGKGSHKVTAATVKSGFEIGCNTDVTSGVSPSTTLDLGGNLNGGDGLSGGVYGEQDPSVSVTLKPGKITDVTLGTKKIVPTAGYANIHFDNVHVNVDGCLGPVALRPYTTVTISTDTNDDTINAYGQPSYL